MDVLLNALINKDFKKAEELLNSGKKLVDIQENELERALYRFLCDYDIMLFLTQHRFNVFHFPYILCRDEQGRAWGVVGRAYWCNNRKVIELLFSAGFDIFSYGQFWLEGKETPEILWKVALLERFDKQLIDLMLSYGCDPECILIHVDDPDYDQRACNYLKSRPLVKIKGYGLGYWWKEIPKPIPPRVGLFATRKKREELFARFDEEMYQYQEQEVAKKEYIDQITAEEWQLIKARRELEPLVVEALECMAGKNKKIEYLSEK